MAAIITGPMVCPDCLFLSATLEKGSVEGDPGVASPQTHTSIESLVKDEFIHQIWRLEGLVLCGFI